jgi:hypothetical protein
MNIGYVTLNFLVGLEFYEFGFVWKQKWYKVY